MGCADPAGVALWTEWMVDIAPVTALAASAPALPVIDAVAPVMVAATACALGTVGVERASAAPAEASAPSIASTANSPPLSALRPSRNPLTRQRMPSCHSVPTLKKVPG